MTAKLILFHHDRARAHPQDERPRERREGHAQDRGPARRRIGPPTVIHSGVVVAGEIELDDRFENLGAQMAREVAAEEPESAGDGTTTATVLAQSIVNEGMEVRGVRARPNGREARHRRRRRGGRRGTRPQLAAVRDERRDRAGQHRSGERRRRVGE